MVEIFHRRTLALNRSPRNRKSSQPSSQSSSQPSSRRSPAAKPSSGRSPQDNPFATTAPPPPPARRRGGCLGCLGQLVALGVVSGGAIAVGVGVAQIYPRPGNEPPWVVQGWQAAQGAIAKLLPGSQPWLGEMPPAADLPDIDFSPSPDVPPTDSAPKAAAPGVLALEPAQREALRLQLQDLQAQLNQLIGETAALEQQLGDRPLPNLPLEQRLEAIAQQLTAATQSPGNAPENAPENQTPDAQASDAQAPNNPAPNNPAPNNPAPNNQNSNAQTPDPQTSATNTPNLIAPTLDGAPSPAPAAAASITLPSDALFRDTYATLRPEATAILDNVLTELATEGGATIRISAHTDSVGDAQDNRELSLRRAGAIAQYLAPALPEGYRWVMAGFGESRPIALGEDDTSLQRNRRIELQIDPH